MIIRFGSSRRRVSGIGMRRAPDRYCPVMEAGLRSTSAGVPCAITRPPALPAAGPISIRWSALRIASSSCSTTSTVLPISRRRRSVASRRSLSRWCRPMLGSSSTYSTPVSPLPICDASRMRCDSPPESVAEDRPSER
ncbi:hypothetical protein J4558_22840 [Leptolyngbya sp. 15MV]|nr:hypothetical protein J4558_22840 [Leptolyngbya sp. 15MV]